MNILEISNGNLIVKKKKKPNNYAFKKNPQNSSTN